MIILLLIHTCILLLYEMITLFTVRTTEKKQTKAIKHGSSNNPRILHKLKKTVTRYLTTKLLLHCYQWQVNRGSTEQHTTPLWWWSGIVVSALASTSEVNLRRARLVLRWATVSGFNSRCRTIISVCNQPATQGQLSLPSLRGR